jgi:hypothetical protein
LPLPFPFPLPLLVPVRALAFFIMSPWREFATNRLITASENCPATIVKD